MREEASSCYQIRYVQGLSQACVRALCDQIPTTNKDGARECFIDISVLFEQFQSVRIATTTPSNYPTKQIALLRFDIRRLCTAVSGFNNNMSWDQLLLQLDVYIALIII